MKTYTYTLTPMRLMGSELLGEASAEELRVLICLMECGGEVSLASLAKAAGVKEARAASAISFFEAGGVLTDVALRNTGDADTSADGRIVDEFAYRLREGDVEHMPSKDVAEVIRDHDLCAMLTACADLLGKPHLGDIEVRSLTALYTQYGLDEEYIVTLLGDLCSRSKRPSVRSLVNRAIKLAGEGVDTTAALNDFLRRRDEGEAWERRVRSTLGIYSRALTGEEKMLFRKWVELFGFGEDILALAYEKTVRNTSKYSAAYMDKILTDWYENKCFTKDACEQRYASSRPATAPSYRKDEPPKERYGNFDPEEAFRRALERSYNSPKTPPKN